MANHRGNLLARQKLHKECAEIRTHAPNRLKCKPKTTRVIRIASFAGGVLWTEPIDHSSQIISAQIETPLIKSLRQTFCPCRRGFRLQIHLHSNTNSAQIQWDGLVLLIEPLGIALSLGQCVSVGTIAQIGTQNSEQTLSYAMQGANLI